MALDSNISLQGAICIEEATIGEVGAATAKEVAVLRKESAQPAQPTKGLLFGFLLPARSTSEVPLVPIIPSLVPINFVGSSTAIPLMFH